MSIPTNNNSCPSCYIDILNYEQALNASSAPPTYTQATASGQPLSLNQAQVVLLHPPEMPTTAHNVQPVLQRLPFEEPVACNERIASLLARQAELDRRIAALDHASAERRRMQTIPLSPRVVPIQPPVPLAAPPVLANPPVIALPSPAPQNQQVEEECKCDSSSVYHWSMPVTSAIGSTTFWIAGALYLVRLAEYEINSTPHNAGKVKVAAAFALAGIGLFAFSLLGATVLTAGKSCANGFTRQFSRVQDTPSCSKTMIESFRPNSLGERKGIGINTLIGPVIALIAIWEAAKNARRCR